MLLNWLVREFLRLEYRPNREYWRRFDISYHELSTESCLSVPEKASWTPMLQSTWPLCPLQLVVLTAQYCLLRQTKEDVPEHDEQPSVFQYKFWSVPLLNSST